MYTGNVVSYRAIMDKQISEWGFEIEDAQAIEWLAEFMAHTKVGMIMEHKIAYLTVCDGRADLPIDLYKIVQVAHLDCIDDISQAECGKGRILPMRWSTDNFHMRYHKDDRDYTTESAETYTVGQGYIFPSFSKGFLAISYEAIPTDDQGYPTIPGDQSWLEAASHYLAYKEGRKRWMQDALTTEKFGYIERDKEWYFAQAVNTKFPQNVDQMESQKNAYVRTIPDIQAHASFFANMQLPEQRKFRTSSAIGLTTSPNNLTQSSSNLASNVNNSNP
jgi:hypothetical protein